MMPASGSTLALTPPPTQLRAPHLHHLYIGLVVASFGCIDRLESVLLMAIGSGVFVQGLGAYGFAPLAVVSDCKTVALPVPMAKSLALGSGCTWEDALQPLSAMVRLIVCPADTASQAQSQHMRCGHAL